MQTRSLQMAIDVMKKVNLSDETEDEWERQKLPQPEESELGALDWKGMDMRLPGEQATQAKGRTSAKAHPPLS